jgi:hypothetical protein
LPVAQGANDTVRAGTGGHAGWIGDDVRMTNRGWMSRAGVFALLLAGAAVAQEAPLPVGAPSVAFYRDDDEAAKAVHYTKSADPRDHNRVLAELSRAIKRDPRHVGLRAARGYEHALGGDGDAAEADFATAASLAGGRRDVLRHVYWSWGWARLALDAPREALAHWQNAARLHGGAPAWLPYSNAVALWRLDQRDLALAWFDVAVRSQPALGTPDGIAALARNWKEKERRSLEVVFDAWSSRAAQSRPSDRGS